MSQEDSIKNKTNIPESKQHEEKNTWTGDNMATDAAKVQSHSDYEEEGAMRFVVLATFRRHWGDTNVRNEGK